MQSRHSFILFLSIAIIFSCKKEGIQTLLLEGIVRDNASGQPITGIWISIDAIKAPSGMGIVTDGKRETVGSTTTDANGYYKVRLNVFKEAELLEFSLNAGQEKEGYADLQQDIYISGLNKSGHNQEDFTVSPTALLTINFKNASPVSDTDFFYFGWYANGYGATKGIIQKTSCGTVAASEALTWTGKDVCGSFTVETIAESNTHVFWTVKKSGITKQYNDSVFVHRGQSNEFSIKY